MFRKPKRKENHHTQPDHRPMLPEFRTPSDPVEEAIRDVRRRKENESNTYQNWR